MNLLKTAKMRFMILLVLLLHFGISTLVYSQNRWERVKLQGLDGGNIRALVIHPSNSTILYAGVDGGGVYQSRDLGQSWERIDQIGLQNLNILSLAIAPEDPSEIYAGTKNGLYKSNDGGISWNFVTLWGTHINDIEIDTLNQTQYIFLAAGTHFHSQGETSTDRGVWFSTDHGNSWTENYFVSEGKARDVYCIKAIRRGEEFWVYVGTNKGIWISTDSGNSWPGFQNDNDLHTESVLCFATFPNKADTIFAGTTAGIIGSKSGGIRKQPGKKPDPWFQEKKSLERRQILDLIASKDYLYAATNDTGFFRLTYAEDCSLNIDWIWPAQKQIHQLVEIQSGQMLLAATFRGVFKSSNQGTEWQSLSDGIHCPTIHQLYIGRPGQDWYIATNLGGYQSKDGQIWEPVLGLVGNLTHLIRTPDALYAAFAEGDTLFIRRENSVWQKIPFEDRIRSIIAGTNCVFVAGAQQIWRVEQEQETGIGGPNEPVTALGYNGTTLYAGTREAGLWEYPSGGTWHQVYGFTPENGEITCIDFGHDSIFVGTIYGLYAGAVSDEILNPVKDYKISENNIKDLDISTMKTLPNFAVVAKHGMVQSYTPSSDWRKINKNRGQFRSLFKQVFVADSLLYASTEGGQLFKFEAEPEAQLNLSEINFAGRRIQQNHSIILELTNSGEWPLEVLNLEVTKQYSAFSFNADTGIVFPAQKFTCEVIFKPDTIKPYRDTLKIQWKSLYSNGNATEIDMPLQGNGIAPFLEFHPNDTLNFDQVRINGGSRSLLLTVRNSGNDTGRFKPALQFISGKSNAFSLPYSFSLASGQEHEFDILFQPGELGLHDANLSLIDEFGAFLGTHSIQLTGEGVEGPLLATKPDTLRFFPIRVGGSDMLEVTLISVGSEGVQIDSIWIEQNHINFSFDPPIKYDSISPGDSITKMVHFRADTVVEDTAELVLLTNVGGEETIRVPMIGRCVRGAILQAVPKLLDFNSVYLQSDSIRNVTITNTGATELVLKSTNHTCYFDSIKSGIENDTLQSEESQTFKVRFIPQEIGELNCDLNISSNAVAGDNFIKLRGESVGPVFNWPKQFNLGEVRKNHVFLDSISVQFITPNSTEVLSFNCEIVGPDSAYFKISSDKQRFTKAIMNAVQSDDFTKLYIQFEPDDLRFFNATIQVSSDLQTLYGNLQTKLSGKGIFSPVCVIEPPAENYDQVPVGKCRENRFKIYNRGGDTLKIINFQWDPPEISVHFVDSLVSDQIAPGDSTELILSFCPISPDTVDGKLLIQSNTEPPVFVVLLEGIGVASELCALDTINFGTVTRGNIPIDTTVSLYNSGNAPLRISAVKIEPPGCFSTIPPVADINDLQIQPGDFWPLTINFQPGGTVYFCESDLIIHTRFPEDTSIVKLRGAVNLAIEAVKLDSIPNVTAALAWASVIPDTQKVDRVNFWLRSGGDPAFQALQMVLKNKRWEQTIPAKFITMKGLEYKIEVIDPHGNSSWEPLSGYFSARVYVEKGGIMRKNRNGEEIPQPHGEGESGWRMLSIPFQLHPAEPTVILQRNLGENGERAKSWDFVQYRSSNRAYVHHFDKSLKNFEPGYGFWLITKKSGKKFGTSPSLTITDSTNQPFPIMLEAGWNIIGNPFNFPISDSLLEWRGEFPIEIRSYDGNWNDPFFEPVKKLWPWEGYAVHSWARDTLLVYPATELLARQKTLRDWPRPSVEWSVKVIAECGYSMVSDTRFGVSEMAQIINDSLKAHAPSGTGNYIRTFFSNSEKTGTNESSSAEYVNHLTKGGNSWELNLETNVRRQMVKIRFEKYGDSPDSIYFVDKALKKMKIMRYFTDSYQFLSGSTLTERKFLIIVGTPEYLANNTANLNLTANSFELHPIYPNPFRSLTNIYYTINRNDRVYLQIYNVLGQQVRSLLDGEWRSAGKYSAFWDGTNKSGEKLASGIYFIKLRSGGHHKIQKIVKLR